LVEINEINY